MKIAEPDVKMADPDTEQQASMISGEVMEVMMTGGEIGEMNEETVAQVVNMLQMEGQLTSGNNTIIIRQPGSSEIQMIQTSNNSGELIVTKASEADIQALQANNGILENENEKILEGENNQVMMMDEGGNIVEGVVQMQETEEGGDQVMELTQSVSNEALLNSDKSQMKNSGLLEQLVEMHNVDGQDNLLQSPSRPITISTTTGNFKSKVQSGLNGGVVSIKINTGLSHKKKDRITKVIPQNVIKIQTVTGQQKYQPPKFHKCEACAVNLVSRVAYMNHMENCPSKKTHSNKSVTYTCVFCETKFTSRLVLMQHVRTCDKAKSSKNLSSSSRLKVTTSESKLKVGDNAGMVKGLKGNEKNRNLSPMSRILEKLGGKKSILDPEDEDYQKIKLDSEDEDDEDIIYDDDEDINDEDLNNEENIEDALNKRSQKHLGPILVNGMFKCRDCNRTFSKEHQYNRHVKACTNAPLNIAKNADQVGSGRSIHVTENSVLPPVGVKRKRGRPPLRDYANEDGRSPAKKRALGPKIVSVNPKNVGLMQDKPKFLKSTSIESDDDSYNSLQKYQKTNAALSKLTSSNHSKVVKISPSDMLIKQTSKAILNKMNKEKYSKYFKEAPFCGLCGDKFKVNEDLVLHTQVAHSEDLLNLRDALDGKGNLSSQKCPLCDLHFVSPHMLLIHMVSMHEQDLKTTQELLENQNLNLICPFCLEFSLTQDLLKEHLATKHLDMFINKSISSNLASSTAADIQSFIKENSSNADQPDFDLGKKEKILCNECGLYFFKSYLQHHRCAADAYSISARKFYCSETQCSSLSFFKLIHLLTHLQQVHEKDLTCVSSSFDSLTSFLEWLKGEETQTKMKFTKAFQRMKQGTFNTVWICHRFHNAMRDSNKRMDANVQSPEKRVRCYSRIHTQTCFNESTSRYDGKTTISYYPDHHHGSSDMIAVIPEKTSTKAVPVVPTSKPAVSASVIVTPSVAVGPVHTSSAFSDAAELKQLLEGDDDFDRPEKNESSFGAVSLPEAADKQDSVQDSFGSVLEENRPSFTSGLDEGNQSRKDISQSFPSMELKEGTMSSADSQDKVELKEGKEVSGLVSFSDTDLLLEKMLGEHESESNRMCPVPSTVSSSGQALAPTEAKITDVDMLEAFGGCLTPEEASNSSIPTESYQKPESDAVVPTSHSSEEAEASGSKTSEEENTYVLPADVEEWSKLFELVASQVESKSLENAEEEEEAKSLLAFETEILEVPLERQIHIFNRLCALANVQMT